MGAVGLEPTRPFKVNGFSFSRSFRYCLLWRMRIGLSLYPRLYVRVAPVESLHLPKPFWILDFGFWIERQSQISNLKPKIAWLGSGLPYLLPDLGFPEFESIHLTDFSISAQFFKSVASAIPPRPRV